MKALTPHQIVYRTRLATQSEQRRTAGFTLVDLSTLTVPLTLYMKALDDVNAWRRRALDAESRLMGSGDILGEGRLPALKGGNSDDGQHFASPALRR
jgi:hypothetical protein